MFTGIVEALGEITGLEHHANHTATLTLSAPSATLAGLDVGGSLAVQDHVDGVSTVARIDDEGSWRRYRVAIPRELAEQTAEKGSVALDGASLTITAVSAPGEAEAWLEVALIPETLAVTSLGKARVGTRLNIETDVLAKYTARLFAIRKDSK